MTILLASLIALWTLFCSMLFVHLLPGIAARGGLGIMLASLLMAVLWSVGGELLKGLVYGKR